MTYEEKFSLFDPFNLIFEGICDKLLSIHSTAPIPQLTQFSNVEEVLELSVQSMLENYDPSLSKIPLGFKHMGGQFGIFPLLHSKYSVIGVPEL